MRKPRTVDWANVLVGDVRRLAAEKILENLGAGKGLVVLELLAMMMPV